jgi:hypothetical protein
MLPEIRAGRRGIPFPLWAIVLGTLSFQSLAYADTIFGITNDDNLIRVNTSDPSSASLIGTLDTASASIGIFSNGSDLYVYNANQDVVSQINPETAATISTINIGLVASPGEGDLAFRNGVGYLASTLAPDGSFGTTGTLFRFTLTPDSATIISTTIPQLDGLAFSPTGVLYGLAQGGTALYTVDPTTGNATEVGSGTGIDDNCGGFACYGFGGLTFGASGSLFASLSNFSNPNSQLYNINTLTGRASLAGSIPFDQVSGLTATVPEPSNLLIYVFCLLCSAATVVVAQRNVPVIENRDTEESRQAKNGTDHSIQPWLPPCAQPSNLSQAILPVQPSSPSPCFDDQ